MIVPASWTPADGLVLEPNALRAAKEIAKTLALTAGPGAGKTEMLAQRADFLLRTGLCPYPQRILAISFKVDASRNLRERVRRRCAPALASRFDSHTFHAFAKRLIDRFRPALAGENALDADYVIGPQRVGHTSIMFEDLVPLAVEILQTSDVALNAVRQTYSHVFLDEFQDCTNAQYSLIRAAFKGTAARLTAVGDTKQRIMGWAGALEGIFLKFAADFGAVGLNLYQNFRSKPRLRRMQNRMVKILEPAAAVGDDAIKGSDGDIETVHFEDSLQEAIAVADLIQHWINSERLPASEIAILVSKQPELYAESLMAELQGRGIPYRNEQKLQDLSVEPIARLIVDFLSVVFGEREPDAYSRLMAILTFANLDDESRLQSKWQYFLDSKRRIHASLSAGDMNSIRLLIKEFLDESGRQFLVALSAEYEQGTYLDKKIEETIEHVSAIWKQDEKLASVLARFSEDRAVRILTIHKSKGLEFDSVILMGVEKEVFFGKIADERAAFFVGISRAKHRLVLTSVDQRPRPAAATKRWDEKRTVQQEFLEYANEP
jgi:superfamily I DNA/RNA helicase